MGKKELTETDLARKKKLASRKFLVWVTWLILVLLIFALCIVSICITKGFDNAFIKFLTDVLQLFFAISMMYLGMNVGQKGIFALKDFLAEKKSNNKGEYCE